MRASQGKQKIKNGKKRIEKNVCQSGHVAILLFFSPFLEEEVALISLKASH
jgi:hypothetical protein